MPAWFSQAAYDLEAMYARQVSAVYKVCYSFMRNAADAEDAVQSVFLKAMSSDQRFLTQEHEHAWFIRVAANHCKDSLKSAARGNAPLDAACEAVARCERYDSTLDAVLALPPKYKDAVYLYYYEGYTADEVARILNRSGSTVRSHLSEARSILKQQLGGDLQ
ncbi:MAG: RNA polymerase sigma factor [Eggerthellaceae bacterium]|nr:RNA polymerase sigma factor [Eggerthellaceae bacterium]